MKWTTVIAAVQWRPSSLKLSNFNRSDADLDHFRFIITRIKFLVSVNGHLGWRFNDYMYWFYVKNCIFVHITDKIFPVPAFGEPCPLTGSASSTGGARTPMDCMPKAIYRGLGVYNICDKLHSENGQKPKGKLVYKCITTPWLPVRPILTIHTQYSVWRRHLTVQPRGQLMPSTYTIDCILADFWCC